MIRKQGLSLGCEIVTAVVMLSKTRNTVDLQNRQNVLNLKMYARSMSAYRHEALRDEYE